MKTKKNDKLRTYSYKMALTPEQEKLAELYAYARNIAYSYAAERLQEEYYKKIDDKKIDEFIDKEYDWNGLQTRMTQWRKTHPIMCKVPFKVMHAAFMDVKHGYTSHRRRVANRPSPKVMSDPNIKQTFQLFKNPKDVSYIEKINHNWGITLLNREFGLVKLELGQEWHNHRLKTVVIKKVRHTWRYIAVYETDKVKHHKGDGSMAGIDRNGNRAVALHTGEFYDLPESVERYNGKIDAISSKLENKVKGSNRHYKLSERRQDYYDKKKNTVRGFTEHVVHDVSTRFDTVSFEDLDLNGMAQKDWDNKKKKRKSKSKRKTNRNMRDANHGQLDRKMDERTEVIKVPAEYTSQDCPVTDCGHRSRNNRKT